MCEITNWLVAFGTIGLAITAVFGSWIRSLIWKPSLRISIRGGRQDCHKTFLSDPSTGKIKSEVYYLNFWINNEGNFAARNIEIHAKELRRERLNKTWEIVSAFPPMNLKWAHTNKDSCLLLLNGVGKQCNLGHISDPSIRRELNEENPSLGLSTAQTSFCFDLIVSPNHNGHIIGPGIYHLDIVLAAENHKPIPKTVELNISGKWDINEEVMLNQGFGVRIL